MVSLLKSTVLSVGLLVGLAATAHAQSVSALPPDGGTSTPTAQSPVYGSTQSFFPKPGGGGGAEGGALSAAGGLEFQ
jgi:hypothetical protein